jgi:hypothetical protein
MRKTSIMTAGAAGALALTMIAASPVAAQSYYRDRDDDRT